MTSEFDFFIVGLITRNNFLNAHTAARLATQIVINGSFDEHDDKTMKDNSGLPTKGMFLIERALPILHAGPHALFTGTRHTLNRELTKTSSHHGHGSEFASCPRTGAVGVLPVETVLCGAAHSAAVVRANQRDLHAGLVTTR